MGIPSPSKLRIGVYIKTAREEAKVTQDFLARHLGVTTLYISDLENDRRQPSLPLFIKIANGLNVSLDKLAGRKP